MDFEFSEDQELLRDTLRRFLAQRAPMSYVRSMLSHPTGFSDEVWHGMADIGTTGLLVPEDHGGHGGGMVDIGVVAEELGRSVHPGPFATSAVGAVSLLLSAGDDEARAHWLPGLAAGDTIGTVALLDDGVRYDWRTPHTHAADETVTGVKCSVGYGGAADLALVVAHDKEGLGVWAVETGASGTAVAHEDALDGSRRTATISYDATPARRIGPGDHTEAVAVAVDRLVVAHAVDAVGAADQALGLCVDHAKQRHQFGLPIGAFQAVQHMCADMLRAVELGRAACYYACWAADAADQAEARRAAAMAAAWAAEELTMVGETAIQVFGGIGFTWEHDIHLYYKRLLSGPLALGTADDHLSALADAVVGPGDSPVARPDYDKANEAEPRR